MLVSVQTNNIVNGAMSIVSGAMSIASHSKSTYNQSITKVCGATYKV